MNDYVETTEHKGYRVHLTPDPEPFNPRKDFEPMGKMVCFHSRYDLGDEHNYDRDTVLQEIAQEVCPNLEFTLDFWNGPGYEKLYHKYGHKVACEKVDQKINTLVARIINRKTLMLPLYLYDHGGITMSCNDFHDIWDSGQVGFIFMTKDQAAKEYDTDTEKRALDYMAGEVRTYAQYLEGDCWGYSIDRPTEDVDESEETIFDEDIDSCWGFFGHEYAKQSAIEAVEADIQHLASEARAELDRARQLPAVAALAAANRFNRKG